MTGSDVTDEQLAAQHAKDLLVEGYARRAFGPQVVEPAPPPVPSASPAGPVVQFVAGVALHQEPATYDGPAMRFVPGAPPDPQVSEEALLAAYVAQHFPG